MLYFESNFGDLTWIEDGNIVNFVWKGYATSEEFRLVCNKATELLQLKKSRRLLTDNTNMPVFSKDDQEWLNTIWFPGAVKIGLNRLAFVEPNKIVQKGVVDRITKSNNNDALQTAEFPNYDEAVKWLKL